MAEVRRRGLRSAAEARRVWEEAGRFPLEVLDRASAAHARGPAALCTWLADETQRLFAAPLKGRAHVLDGAQEAEARVAAGLRSALRELAGLAPDLLPEPEELVRLLGALPVRVGRRAAADCVTVADPLRLLRDGARTRRSPRASVATGWITDERPHPTRARLADAGFHAPLDLVRHRRACRTRSSAASRARICASSSPRTTRQRRGKTARSQDPA